MKYLLIRIIATLKRLIRLHRLLIAHDKAEIPPGRSKVAQRIRKVCKTYNVDADLAVRVARCESDLDPLSININRKGSIDRGIFQFNDKYEPTVDDDCAFNIECSTKEFCIRVKRGELWRWNASQKCWGHKE